MITRDDRTAEEKQTHRILVKGTDTFLSGWGDATGGKSVAAWACEDYDAAHKVLTWVKGRSDMRYVSIVSHKYRPGSGTKHYHIYAVRADHRALDR